LTTIRTNATNEIKFVVWFAPFVRFALISCLRPSRNSCFFVARSPRWQGRASLDTRGGLE